MNSTGPPPIDSGRWLRLKAHLADLAELAPAPRAEASRALALDEEDRRWLDKLLAQLNPEDTRLKASVRVSPMEYTTALRWQTGEIVDAYCIDGFLGRGGMGEVFAAHSIKTGEPVALKTLRHGLQQSGYGHFSLNEQRVLQRLNDPHIARFIDAFSLPEMGVCLVLERVEGEPLNLWCQGRKPAVDVRLAIFVQICQAVASAHQQMVVHRDLKPANVLVTNDGQIKLLDFGVAKLLDDGDSVTQTQGGLFTLEFAAPEQVLRQPVSAATDIYALGVLLFQLLTDTSPYLVGTHESMVKAVLSDRPRSLISTHIGQGSNPVAFDRDLDRVIARAMEKDPRDRYRSAMEMAADVQAIRDGAPLSAGGGNIYRAAKFARRHPAGVAMTLMVALTLIAATVFGMYWAQRADAQAAHAAMQAHRAEAANRFLIAVLDVSDRFSDRNRGDLTLAQVLNRAVELAGTELADEPEVRADVLARLSGVLQRRGEMKRARQAATEAQSILAARPNPDKALYALALQRLASIEIDLLQTDAADQHLGEAQRLLDGVEGNHAELKINLAISIGRVASLRGDLAAALRVYEAIPAMRADIAGDQRADAAMDFNNIGAALVMLSRFREANTAYERAITLFRDRMGEGHPRLVVLRTGHVAALINLARFDEARTELARVTELLSVAPDPTDPGAYHALVALQLAAVEFWTGNHAEALSQMDAFESTLSERHRTNALTLRGRVAFGLGDADQADRYFREAELHYEGSGAGNHPRRWLVHGLAAIARITTKPTAVDAAELAKAINALAADATRFSAEYAELLLRGGTAARLRGDWKSALTLHQRCDAILRRNGWLGELGRAWIEAELAEDELAQSRAVRGAEAFKPSVPNESASSGSAACHASAIQFETLCRQTRSQPACPQRRSRLTAKPATSAAAYSKPCAAS